MPAQGTAEQQDDVQEESQPLLSSSAQTEAEERAASGQAVDQQQPKVQPGSPSKAVALQQSATQLSKQGSGIGRVKSQELGQCR